MSPRRLIRVLLSAGMLALLSVGALACASRDAPTSSGVPVRSTATTTAPASLPALGLRVANLEWTLVWFVVDGAEYHGIDGPPITLRMDPKGASVSGASGCTRYSGTYAAEGVALHLQLTDVPRATCSAPVTTREHAYLQALSRVEAYGSTIGELMLGSVDGQTLLDFDFSGRFPPAPTTTAPTATVATSPLRPGVAFRLWALTRFSQDGRDYLHMANAPVTLWLDEQGAVVGGGVACHGYGGFYVANAVTLRLQVIDENRVECVRDDADAVDLLYGEYLDALGFVDTYRLEDGQLVLTSGGGRLQLTFSGTPLPEHRIGAGAQGGHHAALWHPLASNALALPRGMRSPTPLAVVHVKARCRREGAQRARTTKGGGEVRSAVTPVACRRQHRDHS
jgi:heat shock protein HslJ